jgi:signal transduction histidine kinase
MLIYTIRHTTRPGLKRGERGCGGSAAGRVANVLTGCIEDAYHLGDDFLSMASHELKTPMTNLVLLARGSMG